MSVVKIGTPFAEGASAREVSEKALPLANFIDNASDAEVLLDGGRELLELSEEVGAEAVRLALMNTHNARKVYLLMQAARAADPDAAGAIERRLQAQELAAVGAPHAKHVDEPRRKQLAWLHIHDTEPAAAWHAPRHAY